MRIREGVVSSQWAGECGQEVRVHPANFQAFVARAEKDAAEHAEQPRLVPGDVVETRWAGTDPDAFEVTEVVADLTADLSLRQDWSCTACQGAKCARCDWTGWHPGEDRFVVEHKGHPYLCLTRYHEIVEGDEG